MTAQVVDSDGNGLPRPTSSYEIILWRIAGLPIRWWLDQSSPNLFRVLRESRQQQVRYTRLARQSAGSIGELLIPCATLCRDERRVALHLRRQLHNGHQVSSDALAAVESLARHHCSDRDLADSLVALKFATESLASIGAELCLEVTKAVDRQLAEPSMKSDWVARRLISSTSPRSRQEVRAKRKMFNSWNAAVARAATKTTPRGWYSTVTPGSLGGIDVAEQPAYAAVFRENVFSLREQLKELTARSDTAGVATLTLNPLRATREDRLEFWVRGPGSAEEGIGRTGSLRKCLVKNTGVLAQIVAFLGNGGMPMEALVERLAKSVGPDGERGVSGLVRHLVDLGLLVPSGYPKSRLEYITHDGRVVDGDVREDRSARREEPPIDSTYYCDVYKSSSGLRCTELRGLDRALADSALLLRIRRAIREDQRLAWGQDQGNDVHKLVDVEASILDNALHLQSQLLPEARWRGDYWPQVQSPDSSYAGLVDHLRSAASAGTDIRVTGELLDEYGVPEVADEWPVDYLVRPVHGPRPAYVLRAAVPSGCLDARFAEDMSQFANATPLKDYETFLASLETASGFQVVELLAPPDGLQAANAVRRPLLQGAWTGDPDSGLYTACLSDDKEYVPLDALSLRRTQGGRVLAFHGKRPVWTMMHTTRVAMKPWDAIASLLQRLAPPVRRDYGDLRSTVALMSDRRLFPRIVVGEGGLIVSPAQWRVGMSELWDKSERLDTKIRRLERLRRSRRLPRWVFVRIGRTYRAVDCESVTALGLFEAAMKKTMIGSIVIEEMIPSPEFLAVSDFAGDEYAAEVLIRSPAGPQLQQLGARIGAGVRAAHAHIL